MWNRAASPPPGTQQWQQQQPQQQPANPPQQQQQQWGPPQSHNTSNMWQGPPPQQPQAPASMQMQGPPQWQQNPQQGGASNWQQQQQQWQQQQSMCNCCQQQPGQSGCCQQMPGQPVDVYCCGPPPPADQPEMNPILQCCDGTFCTMLLFFLLSIIGIGIVIGMEATDNLYKKFNAQDSAALQTSIIAHVPYLLNEKNKSRQYTDMALNMLCPVWKCPDSNNTATEPPISSDSLPANPAWTFTCLHPQKVTGSFGTVCMEATLNAATFSVQLASWNNSRGTLYFFAIVLTFFAIVLAYAVHRQKNPQNMNMNQSAQGGYQVSPPIAVSGTPFYEMFRVAWGVSSFIIVFWVANLLTSYKQFADFYLANTSGTLQSFWSEYDKKFTASVVCVGLYLCWPLVHFGIEVGLWFAFVLPWYILRTMCKPGLETMRYDVPLDQQPGWVRMDMFFTEFSDIKRLGFSARAWEFLTGGSKEVFLNCCDQQPGMPGSVQTQQQLPTAPPQWGQPQQQQQQPPTMMTTMQQQQQQQQQQNAVPATPIANRNPPAANPNNNASPAMTHASQDMFQMRTVPPTVANSSSSFQQQDSMMMSSQVRASTAISDGEDRKEKKEKKSKRDKSDKGTKDRSKEKRDKSEKKEKKSKKDKSSKDRGHDSD